MSKSAKTVEEMFEKLVPRLMPPAQQELAVLRDLKEKAHVLKSTHDRAFI
jgi:hypothetical protein